MEMASTKYNELMQFAIDIVAKKTRHMSGKIPARMSHQ